ncbi:MAG: transposase zinc-binding domain-containing protein [Deltaproteobacteria bacterium]|nr:transposase zinc-binding domain-containing protein [Deltaproteobacteria bacterium]
MQYAFWQPSLQQVIYRYLDCGDFHNGFARVRCGDCGHEYLLYSFSFHFFPGYRRSLLRTVILDNIKQVLTTSLLIQHLFHLLR